MNSSSAPLCPTLSPNDGCCPLNRGLSVLDQLLAAIFRANDTAAVDAALDFRLLLTEPHSAEAVLRGFFRLRATAEEQHYLACFRLRRWLESQFSARVHLDRAQPAREVRVRLELPSYEAVCSACLRDAAAGESLGPWTRIRFLRTSEPSFAPAAQEDHASLAVT